MQHQRVIADASALRTTFRDDRKGERDGMVTKNSTEAGIARRVLYSEIFDVLTENFDATIAELERQDRAGYEAAERHAREKSADVKYAFNMNPFRKGGAYYDGYPPEKRRRLRATLEALPKPADLDDEGVQHQLANFLRGDVKLPGTDHESLGGYRLNNGMSIRTAIDNLEG